MPSNLKSARAGQAGPQSATIQHPHIEIARCAILRPNPRNARKHPKEQLQKLAAGISRFGFLIPIIVDEGMMIVAGHGRWEAAKQLGLSEVPVIRASFMTEADKQAFALAENRLAELSEWDEEIVAETLSALFDEGYELDATGFETADLDFMIGDIELSNEKKSKPERVDLPDPGARTVTKEGDLWLIGPYRIYCGDARDPVSWEILLGDDLATLIFADLPYNLPIDGFVSGNGKVRHREFLFGAGEMDPAQFTAFIRAILRNCVRFSVGGAIHYHCMDWRHLRELLDAAEGVYDQFKQLVVWAKSNGGQGSFYRSRHELIAVFKSGTAKHINNFGLGEKGRYRTNVVEYAGCNVFRKGRMEDLTAHSTVKPIPLVADFILDCSNRGDLIVDPCLGSGTTLLAAHRTKRRGAGIEVDPGYVDTALRRLVAATGLTPVLARDGRTFDEIAASRSEQED